MILFLTMLYSTLKRYGTLLLTWLQANKDYQLRQNLLTSNLHCALFHVRKVPVQLAALVPTTLWLTPREIFLMHLSLSGRSHSWHLSLQRPCLLLIKASQSSQTGVSHIDDSDSSVDTTRENSFYIRNFCTTVQSESQQVQSSDTDLPQTYDLRPRLPPPDYHEKVIQNKINTAWNTLYSV